VRCCDDGLGDGVQCNIFELGSFRFSARTNEEKRMWIRALMNVKTKLVCEAPDPSPHELTFFREAVLERLVELQDIQKKAAYHSQLEAMLPLRPRQPVPSCLLGDIWSPDPVYTPWPEKSNWSKRKESSRSQTSNQQMRREVARCTLM